MRRDREPVRQQRLVDDLDARPSAVGQIVR